MGVPSHVTVLFVFILATVESAAIENKKLTDNLTLTVVVGDSSEEDSTKIKATGSIISKNESFTPLGEIGSITNRKSINSDDSDSDNFDTYLNDFLANNFEIDWKKLGIEDYDMFGGGLETDDDDIWKLAAIDGSNKGQQGHGWWQSQQEGAGGSGAPGVNVGQESGVISSNIHRMLSGSRGSLLSGADSNSNAGRQGTPEQTGTVSANNFIGSETQEVIHRYGGLSSGVTGSSGYANGFTNGTGWRNIGDELSSGMAGIIGRQLNNTNMGGFLSGSEQFGSAITLTQNRNVHDVWPGKERSSGTHSTGYWRDLSRSKPFWEKGLNGYIGGSGGGSRWGKNYQDTNTGRVLTGSAHSGSASALTQDRNVQESWPGINGASGTYSGEFGDWVDLSLYRPFMEKIAAAGHGSGSGSGSGWGVNWQGSSEGHPSGSGPDISTGSGLFWKPEGVLGTGSGFGSGTSGAQWGSGGVSGTGSGFGSGTSGAQWGSGGVSGTGSGFGSGISGAQWGSGGVSGTGSGFGSGTSGAQWGSGGVSGTGSGFGSGTSGAQWESGGVSGTGSGFGSGTSGAQWESGGVSGTGLGFGSGISGAQWGSGGVSGTGSGFGSGTSGAQWESGGVSGTGSGFGSGTSGAQWESGGVSGTGSVSGSGAITESGSTFGSSNLHGSGSLSGSGWLSGYTKNDALLARLLAILKAKLMASGAWQKWSASGGAASSQGYLGRGQPGNIVQTIKAKMGKNDSGGSARALLGGYYRNDTAMRTLRNQTSPATQIPARQPAVNTNIRT